MIAVAIVAQLLQVREQRIAARNAGRLETVHP
jgi:xanthine dehydrogenase accessory factor